MRSLADKNLPSPSTRPLVEAGCDVATAAVCLPIYGLIYPVPDPPFNLWPYLMVVWALIGFGILLFISRTRPGMLEAMGRAFSETGDEPDTAKEEVRDRQATGSPD